MTSTTVDISGLDRPRLLLALCKESKKLSATAVVSEDVDAASKALAARKGYVGYYNGVPIKCNLYEDIVDPWLYDKIAPAGQGTFARVVQQLKQQ